MKKYTPLFEGGLSFYDSLIGVQSGQQDMRLTLYDNRTTVGYIDYTIFNDEVSIKMITVLPEYRKKRHGEQLVLELQRMFPKTEIDWGMVTGHGAKLFNKVKNKMYKDVKKAKEVTRLIKRYKDIEKAIEKATKEKRFELLNDFTDEQYDIEQSLIYDYDYREVK